MPELVLEKSETQNQSLIPKLMKVVSGKVALDEFCKIVR